MPINYNTSYLDYLNFINQQNSARNGMAQNNFGLQNQMQQHNTLPGRIVTSVDVVNPGEVPMDSPVAVFPKNDYSEVYLKSWNQNGTINTVVYKPVITEQTVEQNESKVTLDSLNEDVKSLKKEILERFDRLEKSNSNKQNNRSNKMEENK